MKLVFGQNSTYIAKPLPEGEYRAKVVKSEWAKHKQYEEHSNPDGWFLRLWIDVVNKDKRIFCNIPITKAGKLNKLRESAGLKPVGENDDFKAEDLSGKIVKVHLKIYENNEKKLINVVSQFIAQQEIAEDEEILSEKEEDLEETDSEGFPF